MAVIKNINLLGIVVCCLIGGLHPWSYKRGEYPEQVPEDYERDYSPYEDSYVEDNDYERAYEDMMREVEPRRHFRNDPYFRGRKTDRRDPRRDYEIDELFASVETNFQFPTLNKKAKCHPYCDQIATFAPDMCKNKIAREKCECKCDFTRTNRFTPPPLKCGHKKHPVSSDFYKRIIGGSESKAGQWPWVVSINATLINQTESNIWCAGTILSERFVLTARSPFDKDYVYMDPGTWSVTAGNLELNKVGGQTSKVKKVIPIKNGPDYLFENATGKLFTLLQKDIALLELETPLKLEGNVGSLCLISDMDQEESDNCYVAGWGYKEYFGGLNFDYVSNEQNSVKMPVVSNKECNAVYDDLIPKDILCAGWKEGKKDACFFDGGSALACKGANDRWYVNGIVSTGYECARPDGYSFYTRVRLFTDWIIESILKLQS